MNKLTELLEIHCPNGVEYKRLGDICKVLRGKRLTTRDLIVDGDFPVYHGGIEPIGYYNDSNREANSVMIINVGASAGTVGFCDKNFWSSDGCFCFSHNESMMQKYLYYALQTIEYSIKSKVRKAGIPTLDNKEIERIEIPFPPLEVQEEIVKILDRFVEYAAELQAELQARQEQYEYYRNKLLTFNEIGNQRVIWMKMSEIGQICMCKRIMKNQTNSNSGIPFYKIGTFGKMADAYISQELYEEYKSHYSYPQKGEILISASGTIGRTVIYDGEDAYFQDSNIVWIHNNEEKVLNKYLYYYYQIVEWYVEGGTIKRLYNTNLAKTKIAVPTLAEQERIISILDKFEVLVSDLVQGLPAEIAAVQEQYEYYRNKLLSFPKYKLSA